MPIATVNGTPLFYAATGTSDIPVVLVHGSWGDHHNWDAVVPGLARWFRVVTYDRRGHSQSPRPPGQGTLLEDAMDLAALIEALGLAPAHVVGNSFGSSVALRLAIARPDLLRSLTVHEPPLFALLEGDPEMREPLAAMQARVAAVVALLTAGDAVGGARRFVETIAFGPGEWNSMPERLRQTFIANAPTWLDELQDQDWSTLDLRALARFTAPTLLTRGDRSAPFFPAVVAQIARALPHARQHLFAGAGHVPQLTDAEQYVEVVGAFIDGVGAPPGLPLRASGQRPSHAR